MITQSVSAMRCFSETFFIVTYTDGSAYYSVKHVSALKIVSFIS